MAVEEEGRAVLVRHFLVHQLAVPVAIDVGPETLVGMGPTNVGGPVALRGPILVAVKLLPELCH